MESTRKSYKQNGRTNYEEKSRNAKNKGTKVS